MARLSTDYVPDNQNKILLQQMVYEYDAEPYESTYSMLLDNIDLWGVM